MADEDEGASWSAADSDPLSHRCGFELLPKDVDREDSYDELNKWRTSKNSASCCREVWEDGRCRWHADAEPDVLREAVDERNERVQNLDGVVLRDVELDEGVSFAGCRLRGATFENVTARKADFADSDLRKAQFSDADLSRAQFLDADLRRAQFPDAFLKSAQFRDASLSNAQFPDADLRYAKFSDAFLQHAQFPDAYLHKAQFLDAYLRDAQFPDADLRHAQFPDADLRRAQFPDAFLPHAQFPDADLRHAQFPDADLRRAQFPDAFLPHAQFPDADLRYAQFPDADLKEAQFPDARFGVANLSGADLRLADFSNISVNRATTISDVSEPSPPSPLGAIQSLVPLVDDPAAGVETHDTTKHNDPPDPLNWNQTARVYHDLKLTFDENGFVGRARRFHIDERRARRHETAIEEGWFSWPHLTALVSGTFTGYGVGVRRLLVTMAVLFTVSTVTYAAVPVQNPLLYSIITFTTAPPGEPASLPIWAQIVAGVETFVGTLLIVSLGFVLGNREQF